MISYHIRAQKLIECSDWSHNNLLRNSSLIHCLLSGKWRMVKFHWFIYLNQLLCEIRSFKPAIPCHLTSASGQCTSTWIKLVLVKSLDFRKWGFWFCREVFCFCREVFGFAARYFVFAVRFLVLPWCFCFCREVFGFAVTVVAHHSIELHLNYSFRLRTGKYGFRVVFFG